MLENYRKKSMGDIFIILSVIVLLIVTVTRSVFSAYFTPDSWSYFDISKRIFTDFYRVVPIGHFEQKLNNGYNSGFPPFMPILIALINHVFDIGIFAGLAVSVLPIFVILYLLTKISKKLYGRSIYGLCFFCFMLFNANFVLEVNAGLSIPLAISLQLTLFYLVLRKESFSWYDFAIMGVVGALTALTRVDFLAASMVVGALLFFIDKKAPIFYYLFLFLVLSPWMYFSYMNFGVLFASNNTRTALIAMRSSPLFYLPDDLYVPNIYSDFFVWFVAKLKATYGVLKSLWRTLWEENSFRTICILYIFLFFIGKIKIIDFNKYRRITYGAGLILLSILAVTCLSGYTAPRYFSIYFIFILLYFFIFINRSFVDNKSSISISYDSGKFFNAIITPKRILIIILIISWTRFSFYPFLHIFKSIMITGEDTWTTAITKKFDVTPYAELTNAIIKYNPDNQLVLTSQDIIPDVWMYSTLTDIKIAYPPENMLDIDWSKFYNDFPVKLVYSNNEYLLTKLREVGNLIQTDYPDLWLIEKKQ